MIGGAAWGDGNPAYLVHWRGFCSGWRRFGVAGPVYEIVASGDALAGGDRLKRIRVVETGEALDYRLAEILDDPRER